MPVAVCKSTRKMTSRSSLMTLLVAAVGWLEGSKGAAFSNVVVRRDGVVPVEYFTYDPSSFAYGVPKAAQLAMPSLESVVQVPSAIMAPCLAPCIVPSEGSQGLPPIPSASNAKIITFKPAPPSVPVVMTNKETARGYQYAYAVYDDHTGDKKSQSEQSDGSLVQGQYSFIQPDGSRREVVYTADDLKGFNAVVKNILPEPVQPKSETKEEVKKTQPAPCPESQNKQRAQIQEQNIEKPTSEVEHLEQISKPKSIEKTDVISVKKIEENVPKNPEEKPEKAKAKAKPRAEDLLPSKDAIDTSFPVLTNVISYNDIIKCLQAKFLSANTAVSPLTYILIPSSNGPC